MRRVVVTGMGVVSSIGTNTDEVLASLKSGASGITANPAMIEHGFRSQVAGSVDLAVAEHIDKRTLRFMGPGAAYAHIAMSQAIADAGLEASDISNPRTGLVAGSGGPSTSAMLAAHQVVLKAGAPKRIGPFAVPKCMSSTISANLSTAFKIKGVNYSITSACSTSLHCIGNASEQIMLGKQDVMFAGGGVELDWTLSCLFDAMGAMSSKYNDTPEKASRAFDAARDGFVIAGGGGIGCSKSLSTLKPAVLTFTEKSLDTAPHRMDMTWSPPLARVVNGLCGSRCKASRQVGRLAISTPTGHPPRLEMWVRSKRFVGYLAVETHRP